MNADQYISDHGQWFESAPRPKGVRKRKDKQCYTNAMRFVIEHNEYDYAEGWAWDPTGIRIDHAWAVDPTGKVIDLTWANPEDCKYFGVCLPVKIYAQCMLDRNQDSLFSDGTVPDRLMEPA